MFTTQERRTLDERLPDVADWGDAASVVAIDPDDDRQWEALVQIIGRAAGGGEVGAGVRDDDVLLPLRRIFEIVREHGCQTIVFEHRYVDLDFRSDYAAFWSEQFAERRPITKRLHFFDRRVGLAEFLGLPDDGSYLGYTVIRPTGLGPVGRTVLVPSKDAGAENSVLTRIVDRPSLFGNELPITGVPFMQQDGEFLRCAHTAAWICNHVSWRNGIIGRMPTGQIATLPSADTSPHRPLPASGLNWDQLQGIFSAMGLPAGFYEVAAMPPLPVPLPKPELYERDVNVRNAHDRKVIAESIRRVVCPSLNSGLPVIVLTDEDHAFTLVGWRRGKMGPELIACDDQRGPYVVKDAFDDPVRPWSSIMVPLPAEVMLSGIGAEQDARNTVLLAEDEVLRGNTDEDVRDAQIRELAALAPRLTNGADGIAVRSRLLLGRSFKQALDEVRPFAVRRLFRMAHLPLWVWVVEFQDRELREQGESCVLAEFVYDASSTDPMPIQCLMSTLTLTRDLAEARRADVQRDFADTPRDVPREHLEAQGDQRPWPSLIVSGPTRGTMMP